MGSDETSVANKKIFQRDGYKCRNCRREGGKKGAVELHAHHIVPREYGGRDELKNLVTLCKECHTSVHQGTEAPTVEYKDIQDYSSDSGEITKETYHTEEKEPNGRTRLGDFDE